MLSSIPLPLLVDIVKRVGRFGLIHFISFMSVSKEVYNLAHLDDVLIGLDIDMYLFNAASVCIGRNSRQFFERCLHAKNPTSLLLEGIRVAFVERDCEKAISILQLGLPRCPYNILSLGMCHIMVGRADEGVSIMESMRWWDDMDSASEVAMCIYNAVRAMTAGLERKGVAYFKSFVYPRNHGEECHCPHYLPPYFDCPQCFASSVAWELMLMS